jgi:hypothetical protein
MSKRRLYLYCIFGCGRHELRVASSKEIDSMTQKSKERSTNKITHVGNCRWLFDFE